MRTSPEQREGQIEPEKKEKEKSFFFDIRKKHPLSEELYKKRGEIDEYLKILKGSDNPFTEFDNKEIIHKGQSVGTIRIRKDAFPQCLISPEGMKDCGYYFQLRVKVFALDLDMDSAIDLVLETIGRDQHIDNLIIEECEPLDTKGDSWKIINSHNIDPESLQKDNDE